MTTEPADAIATIRHLRARVAELEETLRMFKAWDFPGDLQDMAVKLETATARADAAEAQTREAALDALAAYGQAADAYAAQVAAEAAITRAWEMGRDAAADQCVERSLYIEDCIKWGGSKTYITSLKGGIIELANVGPTIRRITPPADMIERAKGGA